MPKEKKPIVLMSSRLLLCELSEENAEQVNNYHLRNKEHFKKWSPKYPDGYYDTNFQKELLRRHEKQARQGLCVKFWLFERESKEYPKRIIGDIHFNNIIRGAFHSCFVGYKIDAQFTRKGLMLEAMQKAIDYMFVVEKLHRIEANIMPINLPSIGLIKKLGFQKEGFSPAYLKINAKWEDHFSFALINQLLK